MDICNPCVAVHSSMEHDPDGSYPYPGDAGRGPLDRLWVGRVRGCRRSNAAIRAHLIPLPCNAAVVVVLEAIGRPKLVRFRDLSFRWIDIRRFTIQEIDQVEDVDVLEALIAHQLYHNLYMGPDTDTSLPFHGPYYLEYLTPAQYEEIDQVRAGTALQMWMSRWAMPNPSQIDGNFDAVLTAIQSATSLYHLKDVGLKARHENADILGEFLEIIAIDRGAGVITLIVASED
jgi:hypothetical protein